MGIIKQLKTFITNKQVFPITKTKAVYHSDGRRLDKIMATMIEETDNLSGVEEDTPRDADKLGGELPEYYAVRDEVDKKFSNLGFGVDYVNGVALEDGTEYTVENNSYIFGGITITQSGGTVTITIDGKNFSSYMWVSSGYISSICIPLKKGQTFKCTSSGTGASSNLYICPVK